MGKAQGLPYVLGEACIPDFILLCSKAALTGPHHSLYWSSVETQRQAPDLDSVYPTGGS